MGARALGVVVALVVTVASCSPSQSASDSAGSRQACSHFRNVAGDYTAGVLTLTELRDKLIEVRQRADIATPRVQAAATAVLAAITSGDLDALRSAVIEMTAACVATGN